MVFMAVIIKIVVLDPEQGKLKKRNIAQGGVMSNKSDFVISGIETGKLNAMVKNVMAQTGLMILRKPCA